LIKYNNEIERLYEKMEELSNKIDNLRWSYFYYFIFSTLN
jgi:hypothetical protein